MLYSKTRRQQTDHVRKLESHYPTIFLCHGSTSVGHINPQGSRLVTLRTGRSGVLIPVGARDFVFKKKGQKSRVISGRSETLALLVPKLRISGAMPLLLPCTFMVWRGTTSRYSHNIHPQCMHSNYDTLSDRQRLLKWQSF